MSNFQWGNSMRDGSDHFITILYEEVSLATCPITAVEQWVAVGTNARWDMTQGYLLPHNGRGRQNTSDRFVVPNSTTNDRPAQAARENQDFSMHSFRSGGAVSRASAGEDVSTIVQRADVYEARGGTFTRNNGAHKGPRNYTDEQYRQIHQFPLKEQSKSWAEFGNAPMVE